MDSDLEAQQLITPGVKEGHVTKAINHAPVRGTRLGRNYCYSPTLGARKERRREHINEMMEENAKG